MVPLKFPAPSYVLGPRKDKPHLEKMYLNPLLNLGTPLSSSCFNPPFACLLAIPRTAATPGLTNIRYR